MQRLKHAMLKAVGYPHVGLSDRHRDNQRRLLLRKSIGAKVAVAKERSTVHTRDYLAALQESRPHGNSKGP